MTVNDFLDWLDGRGIVYEDDELVRNELEYHGLGLDTEIKFVNHPKVVIKEDE